MPRHKRRGANHRSDATSDQGDQFPANVRNESRKLTESLIEATASRTSAVEVFSELFDIITKLVDVQKDHVLRPNAGAGPSRLQSAELLLSEMSAQGVELTTLGVAEFDGQGIGLKATQEIRKHDVVLEIPRNHILSSDDAFKSAIGDFLRSDPVCSGMTSMALSVYLLHEACRGSASDWASYIAALPSAYSNCLYFTPSQLILLKGSPAQERVAADFRRICRQYAFFFAQLEKSKEAKCLSFSGRFTFDDFRWAVATVMSRNNPVPQSSTFGCALGLIPLWDFGNHKFGEMTTDFDPEALVLRFHAMEDVAINEQVLFHYGNRSNLDLLTYAGFTVESNPFDKYPVRLGVSDKDPLHELRTEILDVLGIEASETFYLEVDAEKLPSPLIAFVRAFVMTKDELEKLSNSCPDLRSLNEAILQPTLGQCQAGEADVDLRAARFLQTRFKLLLMPLTRSLTQMDSSANFIKILIESESTLLKEALDIVDATIRTMTESEQAET